MRERCRQTAYSTMVTNCAKSVKCGSVPRLRAPCFQSERWSRKWRPHGGDEMDRTPKSQGMTPNNGGKMRRVQNLQKKWYCIISIHPLAVFTLQQLKGSYSGIILHAVMTVVQTRDLTLSPYRFQNRSLRYLLIEYKSLPHKCYPYIPHCMETKLDLYVCCGLRRVKTHLPNSFHTELVFTLNESVLTRASGWDRCIPDYQVRVHKSFLLFHFTGTY